MSGKETLHLRMPVKRDSENEKPPKKLKSVASKRRLLDTLSDKEDEGRKRPRSEPPPDKQETIEEKAAETGKDVKKEKGMKRKGKKVDKVKDEAKDEVKDEGPLSSDLEDLNLEDNPVAEGPKSSSGRLINKPARFNS